MTKEFYLSKRAAITDVDPVKRTAASLFKIIQFLFFRVPKDKRSEFFSRLKGKITRLSPGEISTKKTSPSASIGQSIALSRGLLSGMSPDFIRQVLLELTRILSNISLKQLRG